MTHSIVTCMHSYMCAQAHAAHIDGHTDAHTDAHTDGQTNVYYAVLEYQIE